MSSMGDSRFGLSPNVPAKTLERSFNKGASMIFPGTDECLRLANLAAELLVADNLFGSIEVVFNLNDTSFAAAAELGLVTLRATVAAVDTYLTLSVDATGHLRADFSDDAATVLWRLVSNDVIVMAGPIYHVVLTQDGTGPKLYVNGRLLTNLTSTLNTPAAWLDDMAAGATKNGYIGCLDAANYLNGEIYKVRVYNDALTLPQIWPIIAGEIDYEDYGAQMTQHLSVVPGDWLAGGAALNISMGVGDADLITYLWAADGISTATLVNANLDRVVQSNKRYRFTYTDTITLDPIETLVKTLEVGGVVLATLPALVAGIHHVEFVTPAAMEVGDLVVRIVATTPPPGLGVGSFTMGLLRLFEIGCVAAYEDDSISSDGCWSDKSNSDDPTLELSATAGAAGFPRIKKMPNFIKITKRQITTDTTWADLIPGGYYIQGIIIHNDTANAVTIDIDSAAVSIVAGEVIGANANVNCVLINTILGVDPHALNALTIIDTGGAGWNAASLDMTLFLARFN